MVDTPRIQTAQIHMLERLCNACAVSGDEGEVRQIVLEEVQPHADEVESDALGNLLAVKNGTSPKRLRVMLVAHMDEVGFILTSDEKDGIFRFETVGGLDARFLAGKHVVIGSDHIPGVIGSKPIHLTSFSERKKTITVENLRIDVGPNENNKVKPGDYATFAPNFTQIGRGKNLVLRAKAMDNRVGVTTLIELLKHAPPNLDIIAAFTVQEEIGLRGAQVAAYAFVPEIAIVLDCTPAYDLPNWEDEENTRYNTRLGSGPAIYVADRRAIGDPRLIRFFTETAESESLSYQHRQPGGGGTDAGTIHKTRSGVPSVSISIPGRYTHTPSAMIRLSDWQQTLALVHTGLTRLSPEILREERA